MQEQKQFVQLLLGLICIFPLTFDVFFVHVFASSTRLVIVFQQSPFLLSGKFIMNMSLLLFIVGAGLCYFALQRVLAHYFYE